MLLIQRISQMNYSEVYGGFIKDHDMLYCFNVFLWSLDLNSFIEAQFTCV